MRLLRWACLCCFLLGISGCGPTDPSTDPASISARQERGDMAEQYKAKAAKAEKSGRRPAR